MKKHFYIFMILIVPYICSAQTIEVPFTLADRDRIIQIEEKLNSQQVQINDIKDEIKSMKSEFHFGFGIILSVLIFMFGFIVYDRRTALKTTGKKPLPSTKKEKLLESILKDYAKKQPELAEILKTRGL